MAEASGSVSNSIYIFNMVVVNFVFVWMFAKGYWMSDKAYGCLLRIMFFKIYKIYIGIMEVLARVVRQDNKCIHTGMEKKISF